MVNASRPENGRLGSVISPEANMTVASQSFDDCLTVAPEAPDFP